MAIDTATLSRVRYVRAILEWHGHTATDLAELLGVTRDMAYKKLAGARNFTTGDLVRIAETYGVDPGQLLRPDPLVLKSALGLLSVPKYDLPQVRAAGLVAA